MDCKIIWFFFVLNALPSVQLQGVPNACMGVTCVSGNVCVQGACLPLPPTAPGPSTTTSPDPCDSNPCLNGCECKTSCAHSNGYYCESPEGYLGKNCNIEKPQLNCSADKITVSVPLDLFFDLYPSKPDSGCLYLGEEEPGEQGNESSTCKVCYPSDGYYNISMFLPFTQCGSKMNSTGGMVSFSNMLWAGLKDVDIYDVPVPVLKFQCVYDREYSVFTSLNSHVEEYRLKINDSMKLQAGIELCKIGNECPDACPPMYTVQPGAAYTISETIHAIMSIESSYLTDSNNAVILDQMHLSCNDKYSDKITDSDVVLVLGGCETSLLTTSINRLRSTKRVVCVSFKVPRLLLCKDSMFYIHAKLRVIEQISAPICLGTRRLKPKRSVKAQDPEKTVVVVIPIRVIEGSEGVGYSEIFPSPSDMELLPALPAHKHPTTESSVHQVARVELSLVIGTIVLGLLLVIVLFIVFFVYYCSTK